MPISGLLSIKPDSPPPTVGAVETFTWEQRTGKSGKGYVKIKRQGPDFGGTSCRITSVKPTGHVDQYGNISFNLEIEPQNAPQTSASAPVARSNGGSGDGVADARKAAMQAANLMLLAMEAGKWTFMQYQDKNGVDLPDAHFQALCSTLFIHLDKQGLASRMPATPLREAKQPIEPQPEARGEEEGDDEPF